MRHIIPITAFLVALSFGAPCTAAELEVAPFAAYRFGGFDYPTGIACIALVGSECPSEVRTEDGSAWGLGAAVALKGPWWLDVRYSVQDSDAETDSAEFSRGKEVEWDRLVVGIEHRWDGPGWRPFVAAGIGWTFLESDVAAAERLDVDLTRNTLEAGVGLLRDFGPRLGLRLEARASHTTLPDDLGGDDLDQLEANAALRIRFGA